VKPFLCAILVVAATSLSSAESNEVGIRLKQTIPLPGVEGRLDHLAFDPAGKRLFLCALGNNSVEVLDLNKGERVHSISGLGAPQGIAFVQFGIFVANDKGGICSFYDSAVIKHRLKG
jgi:hypothetical protein